MKKKYIIKDEITYVNKHLLSGWSKSPSSCRFTLSLEVLSDYSQKQMK